MSDTLDQELLLEALPPGVVTFHQHDADFEHLDFIWGADAAQRVYRRVIQLLRKEEGRGGSGGAQQRVQVPR